MSGFLTKLEYKREVLDTVGVDLQCFDAVGWAAGRASGL